MTTRPRIGARPGLAALAAAGVLALSCLALAGPAGAESLTPVPVAVGLPGGFADAYGLAIDADLLAGAIPMVVPPVARAASSCPANKAPSVNQALGGGDPMVAHVDVLTSGTGATCTETTPTAMAKSQLVNVDALGAAAPIAIHADAITALSNSSCATDPSGSVNVVNLTIGGKKITPDGQVPPNTRVADPLLAAMGLTVIINEQNPASPGRGFVVNGIHIIASGQGASLPIGGKVMRGDVVISHAMSGVACLPVNPPNPSPTVSPTCPPGSVTPDCLPATAITFTKETTQKIAKVGDTFTYNATVTNTSTAPCEVLRFIDHIAEPFSLVSTTGAFGTTFDKPTPVRPGDGPDAVLRPTGVVLAPKQTLAQTFTVKVNATALAGTYYDTLELFCSPKGDYVSGPLAPVVINPPLPSPSASSSPTCVPGSPSCPTSPPPTTAPCVPGPPPCLPRTGGSPLVPLGALGLLGAGFAARRFFLR